MPTTDIPNLELVKHGVLVCPACEHLERGTVERACPQCTQKADDLWLADGPYANEEGDK